MIFPSSLTHSEQQLHQARFYFGYPEDLVDILLLADGNYR